MKSGSRPFKSGISVLRVFGWITACLTAVIVGLWSYAIANQNRAPAKVLALGLPAYTAETGDLALASLGARRQQDAEAAVTPLERSLALKAYRSDPLAVSSVGILALDMRAAEKRQQLLELAGRLSRRSSFVSFELVKAAAVRGDEPGFFSWLSRAALTNADARRVYISAMADATARSGALEGLLPVIGPDPSWANFYWNAVNQRPNSLRNGAKLRIALTEAPWRQSRQKPTDPILVRQLVAHNDYETAHELVSALAPERSANRPDALLVNADFSKRSALAPFDWALASSGNLGATIDVRARRLVISAIPGAYGMVARQLLRLDGGSYEFRWKLSSNEPLSEGSLTVNLRCADVGKAPPIKPADLAIGEHRHVFVVPAKSNCQWYWLGMDASVPDDGMGFDAQLGPVRLVKLSESPEDEATAALATPESR